MELPTQEATQILTSITAHDAQADPPEHAFEAFIATPRYSALMAQLHRIASSAEQITVEASSMALSSTLANSIHRFQAACPAISARH